MIVDQIINNSPPIPLCLLKKSGIMVLLSLVFVYCKQNPVEYLLENSTLYMHETISYNYDSSGRKLKCRKKILYRMNGVRIDSSTHYFTYEFTATGKLKRIVDKNPDRREYTYYFYDDRDSLSARYLVNGRDTIELKEIQYDDRGNIVALKNRILSMLEGTSTPGMGRRRYDTTYFRSHSIYDGAQLIMRTTFNSKNELTNEVLSEGHPVLKQTSYEFVNGVRRLKSVNYFDRSKSKRRPDVYHINERGDTILYVKNYFKNDGKLIRDVFVTRGKELDSTIVLLDHHEKQISSVRFEDKRITYAETVNNERGDPVERTLHTEVIKNKDK